MKGAKSSNPNKQNKSGSTSSIPGVQSVQSDKAFSWPFDISSVNSALGALPGIQQSLIDISTRLKAVEGVKDDLWREPDGLVHRLRAVEGVKDDIWGEPDGIEYRLRDVAQVTEDFSKDSLIQENRSLKDEVMLLKSVVIRMDQQMSNMKSQIVDLKRRSMRNNILIHSYEHNANENLIADVPKAINENLGVNVEFVRVHRNGPARPDGKPVTITGKLASLDDKEKILAAQKDKRGKKVKLPFSITAQEPIPLVEERKKLYEISDSYRNRQIMSKVERGKVVLPSGEIHSDPVPELTNTDILETSAHHIESAASLRTEAAYTDRGGSHLRVDGAKVERYNDVKDAYLSVCTSGNTASAVHHVLVYRFKDSDGLVHEQYQDDGDYGTGRRLLQYMRDNQIINSAMIASTWTRGPGRLGFARFGVFEGLINEVANMLDE